MLRSLTDNAASAVLTKRSAETFGIMMQDRQKRADRRELQAREIEANQESLRQSIAETDRLVGESDKMLKRHRKESEQDDAAS